MTTRDKLHEWASIRFWQSPIDSLAEKVADDILSFLDRDMSIEEIGNALGRKSEGLIADGNIEHATEVGKVIKFITTGKDK